MIRIDLRRLRAREKALAILRAAHPDYYADRCSRQGFPPTTAPDVLARHEIATAMTIELLTQEVPT